MLCHENFLPLWDVMAKILAKYYYSLTCAHTAIKMATTPPEAQAMIMLMAIIAGIP